MSDLFDIEKVRDALRDGDGEGVRIAILDSGVDEELEDFQSGLTSYEIAMSGGRQNCVETKGVDELGHGTACAWIIRSIAPKAELHSIKILGGEARGTSAELALALGWAIDNKMDVVNISAGVRGPRSKDVLSAEADRALFEGVTVVAAAHNHGLAAYPANLSSVLTVTYDNFEDTRKFRYLTKQAVGDGSARGLRGNAQTWRRHPLLHRHQLCLPARVGVRGAAPVGVSEPAALRGSRPALQHRLPGR